MTRYVSQLEHLPVRIWKFQYLSHIQWLFTCSSMYINYTLPALLQFVSMLASIIWFLLFKLQYLLWVVDMITSMMVNQNRKQMFRHVSMTSQKCAACIGIYKERALGVPHSPMPPPSRCQPIYYQYSSKIITCLLTPTHPITWSAPQNSTARGRKWRWRLLQLLSLYLHE